MANMRVHELAKELNISSKAITDILSNADKKYTLLRHHIWKNLILFRH